MKKFLKISAVLTALVFGLACFVACSDGGSSNDGGGSSNNGGNVSNNGGGNTNNGGASSNNDEEVVVKPKVTVVATWRTAKSECTYKFYSDGTYEFLEKTAVTGKGSYYGNPNPKKEGDLTIIQKYKYDGNAADLIPTTNEYEVHIKKDYDDNLYLEDGYWQYELVN